MKLLRTAFYSVACGVLLTAFTHVEGITKFVFSLLAFFLGYRFFKTYDSVGLRVAFVVVAIILYFVFSLAYTIVAYQNGWHYRDLNLQ